LGRNKKVAEQRVERYSSELEVRHCLDSDVTHGEQLVDDGARRVVIKNTPFIVFGEPGDLNGGSYMVN
jgi:hypothetical protein